MYYVVMYYVQHMLLCLLCAGYVECPPGLIKYLHGSSFRETDLHTVNKHHAAVIILRVRVGQDTKPEAGPGGSDHHVEFQFHQHRCECHGSPFTLHNY